MEKTSFGAPDSTRSDIEKMTSDTVAIVGSTFIRVTAEPGWHWADHVKPVAGTDSCQVDHLIYVVSGVVATRSDDGTEMSLSAGDIAHIPPGHDGWVVGDDQAVWIELPH